MTSFLLSISFEILTLIYMCWDLIQPYTNSSYSHPFYPYFPSWFYALFSSPLSLFCAAKFVYDYGTTEWTVNSSLGLLVKRSDFQSPGSHQLWIVSQQGGGFMSPSSSTWERWLTCSSASLEHETPATVSSQVQMPCYIWLIVFPIDIIPFYLLQVFFPLFCSDICTLGWRAWCSVLFTGEHSTTYSMHTKW